MHVENTLTNPWIRKILPKPLFQWWKIVKIKEEVEIQEKLKKKRIYNEFESNILEQAKSIEELIASIDENNNDLRDDIDECNDEMT